MYLTQLFLISGAGGPNWAKFGYSQKEVWNWLYTDHDINQNINNNNIIHSSKKPVASTSMVKSTNNTKAVEVKFTLSEFVDCYRRLLGLNLDGFTEFVNRTLEAIISTSMYVSSRKSMTQARNSSKNTTCCHKPQKFFMVPSLQRSAMINRSQQQLKHGSAVASVSGQNKTYVRLSVKQRPPERAGASAVAGSNSVSRAFSCYQTLLDINNPTYRESGKKYFIFNT